MIYTKSEAPKTLVIFFHGYGSNGADLIELSPHLEEAVEGGVFVAPNGFKRLHDFLEGYQWFDLPHMDPHVMQKNCASVKDQAVGMVQGFQKEYGIGPEKTILIGFSQGTMMSLYAALSHSNLCAGVIGFSGGVYMNADHMKADPKTLRVALIHGESDEVVPFRASEEALALLESHGFSSSLTPCARLTHSIDAKGLSAAKAFLKLL